MATNTRPVPSRAPSTVTPGRSYVAVTAQEEPPLPPVLASLAQRSPPPQRQRRSRKNRKRKNSRKSIVPRATSHEVTSSSATRQDPPNDIPIGSQPLDPSSLPAPWKSLATAASHEAQARSEATNGETTPPHVPATVREIPNSTNLSFTRVSQEAFLPAPREGNAEDSTPATAAQRAVPDEEPPCKKFRQLTGPGAPSTRTRPSLGDAFRLLISGISAPFGLPPAPVDPTFLQVQDQALPFQAKATSTNPQQGTPQADPTSLPLLVSPSTSPSHQDTHGAAPHGTSSGAATSLTLQDPTSLPLVEGPSVAIPHATELEQPSQKKLGGTSGPRKDRYGGTSGPRKNRHGAPHGQEPFDPFTRRRTVPRPVVSATRRHPKVPAPPPVPLPAPTAEDMDSDDEYSSASEETVTVTNSGNLLFPERKAAIATIPNPPFEGSLN